MTANPIIVLEISESMIVSSAVNSVPFEHCIFCGDPFSVSGKKFLWMDMYSRISSQPKVICYLQFQTFNWKVTSHLL